MFNQITDTSVRSDGSYVVQFVGAQNAPANEVAYEVFSAGAVIGALASLASSYAEGKTLKALFEQNKDDLAALIDNAINRMVALLQAALDVGNIRRCQAKIQGCQKLLLEFENHPEYKDRLSWAVNESTEAVIEISAFGWKQFEAFGDAVSIRLLALCVLTKDTCSRGELENLKKYVTDCLTDLTNMVEEARLNFQALVDGITPIGYADIRDRTRCNRESGECTYWWDCKPCFGDNGIDVNIPDVGGSSSDAAKANGYARLNPIREARLQGRIDELNRVVRELQEHLAIREAEWKRCCKAAEKFSYKD